MCVVSFSQFLPKVKRKRSPNLWDGVFGSPQIRPFRDLQENLQRVGLFAPKNEMPRDLRDSPR